MALTKFSPLKPSYLSVFWKISQQTVRIFNQMRQRNIHRVLDFARVFYFVSISNFDHSDGLAKCVLLNLPVELLFQL